MGFKTDIQKYTGTIADGDSAQPLADGVKDVVNRMMKISPDSMFMFSGLIQNTSGNSYVAISDTDKILDVNRLKVLNGVITYRNCVEIPASLRGDVQDAGSLHKATEEFPVYYKFNGRIYVLPSAPTADKIQVNKVVYGAITDADGNSSSIANFPTGMVPLVILYASSKIILQKMASYSSLPTDLNFSGLLGSATSIPSSAADFGLSTDILGNSGVLNDTGFEIPLDSGKPSIGDIANFDLGELFGNSGILDEGDFNDPADKKDPTTWFTTLGDMIEDDEDTELATAQSQKISSFLSWYQQALAERLQKFNADYQVWSGKLQNAIQILSKESDTKVQEYNVNLQKYSAHWQGISASVNATVQSFNANLQKAQLDYQWLQERYQFVSQEYEKGFLPYANKGEAPS